MEGLTAYSMDLSPGGTHLTLGTREHDVLIVDARTFETTARLRGHSNEVWAVAWHPREPRLASAGPDGKIVLWDTERKSLVTFLDPGGPMGRARLDPRRRAAGLAGELSVFDARSLDSLIDSGAAPTTSDGER